MTGFHVLLHRSILVVYPMLNLLFLLGFTGKYRVEAAHRAGDVAGEDLAS